MYDQAYTDYQLKRGRIRKFIRKIYLYHTLRFVKGKAIDFGCGIGELLALLPQGSIGYEVNAATVAYCQKMGLNVKNYLPETDRYQLSECSPYEFQTFILSHVLEHLDAPHEVMQILSCTCDRLMIQRLIIIVPGKKGFASDKTHRTFIDEIFMKKYQLNHIGNYMIVNQHYFPFNWLCIGKYFRYHEFVSIYDKK